jgi:hypothetical protein
MNPLRIALPLSAHESGDDARKLRLPVFLKSGTMFPGMKEQDVRQRIESFFNARHAPAD